MRELARIPYPVLILQYGLTVLVTVGLFAAFWFGKLDASVALPTIVGLVSIWLPAPLQAYSALTSRETPAAPRRWDGEDRPAR